MQESERDEIDSRAASLGLNRSQYLVALARKDIASGGDLTIPAALRDAPNLTPAEQADLRSAEDQAVAAAQVHYGKRKTGRKKPAAGKSSSK